jgi:hypothetical protein
LPQEAGEEMNRWINENRSFAVMSAVTIVVLAVLAALQGCDLRSKIVVKAPKDVLAAIDVDEPLTLAQSSAAWEDWSRWVEARTRQFQRAIGDAEDRYTKIETLLDLGVSAANEGASQIPGGAFLVGGLSLLTGIFLKRPGQDKETAKEKEDSYNAGLEEGKRIVLNAIRGEEPKA